MRRRAMPFRVLDGRKHRNHARQEWGNRISDSRRVTQPRRNQISVCVRTIADERNVVGH